jgi:Zn-dependent oligopeptidase
MLRCAKDPEERSASFMDEQQQQRINRAAEEFVNAMVESQRTMAERGVSVQEMNAQLTQQFFNNVINNLQRMTEETQGASQELAEQTQRAQEAAQALAQESTGAYVEFMNSMLTMSQGAVQRGAEEAERRT